MVHPLASAYRGSIHSALQGFRILSIHLTTGGGSQCLDNALLLCIRYSLTLSMTRKTALPRLPASHPPVTKWEPEIKKNPTVARPKMPSRCSRIIRIGTGNGQYICAFPSDLPTVLAAVLSQTPDLLALSTGKGESHWNMSVEWLEMKPLQKIV